MNAGHLLPIESMTVAEKMDVIDRIMDDLSRNSSDVPVIQWHGDMLKKRVEAIEQGDDSFITLDDAEERIRQRTGRE
jgi:hypothetical protein